MSARLTGALSGTIAGLHLLLLTVVLTTDAVVGAVSAVGAEAKLGGRVKLLLAVLVGPVGADVSAGGSNESLTLASAYRSKGTPYLHAVSANTCLGGSTRPYAIRKHTCMHPPCLSPACLGTKNA